MFITKSKSTHFILFSFLNNHFSFKGRLKHDGFKRSRFYDGNSVCMTLIVKLLYNNMDSHKNKKNIK